MQVLFAKTLMTRIMEMSWSAVTAVAKELNGGTASLARSGNSERVSFK